MRRFWGLRTRTQARAGFARGSLGRCHCACEAAPLPVETGLDNVHHAASRRAEAAAAHQDDALGGEGAGREGKQQPSLVRRCVRVLRRHLSRPAVNC